MKMPMVAWAAAFALCSSTALAQGSNTAGAAPQTRDVGKSTVGDSAKDRGDGGGAKVKNGSAGPAAQTAAPSPRDSRTQGANVAGSAENKGDAAASGGSVKK